MSGTIIAKALEWLKFQPWFPIDYDQKQLLRAANFIFAVLGALFLGLVSNELDFTTIEGIRAFATSVAGIMGSEIVVYTGLLKKPQAEKEVLHQIMKDS